MAKIAIICDKRRITNDSKYPVKLRVTHKGRQKYYPLGKYMTEEKFDRIMDPAAAGKNKNLQM
ncbi:MAG: site-specific integrase, partial [Bacteroidetes bacterium]|nr:site-specific integrase [Bacteroidota bacterium]